MKNKTPSINRQRVGQAIARLTPSIIQGVHLDFFVKRGITQTQFLVLMAIHAYDRCTMSTLARNLHVRMPTATGIVSRLVEGGYVRRVPHPDDRRQVIVTLTPRGYAFIRDFQTVVSHRWQEVLRSLRPVELETFHRVIAKLHTQLQAAR